MTNSPASSSDAAAAYERLHRKVQEWIWNQGWQELRPIQVQAIGPVIAGESDVIISAATAGGKTEAAWLPICSALAEEAESGPAMPGVKALYLSPLKALINDQFGRLESLCDAVDMPIYRRHGDVTGADRTALNQAPDGLLLITPESLEALFVNQGTRIPIMLNGLRYVVIDELHSFIGSERGAQLQSLLHRVELAIRRRVPRVALSATLADSGIAAEFLRPGGGDEVTVIEGGGKGQTELQMLLRGYVSTEQAPEAADADDDEDEPPSDAVEARSIAENVYKHMRGKDNLVFANSRYAVETYTDLLTRMCEDAQVPNEFYAHHGNLSKEHREDVEAKLKSPEFHATAICTSTLEMGIDIGSADAVGQIGAPGSVSALRQRLGRSGRRGGPAVLRMYVIEPELTEHTPPVDQLRTQTVQTVAVVELLLEKWYEPPNTASLHLSTLIQQVLSVIAQHGGANAVQLFNVLCAAGPFVRVDRELFVRLLRDLGAADLISQAADGLLLPGGHGEKLLNHYSFYAAFETPQEFRLVAGPQELGSMPVEEPLEIGGLLVFGGRRWKVANIDTAARTIEVIRSRGGKPPYFGSGGPEVADGIRRRMRAIYEGTVVPAYLSATSQRLLDEGRTAFRRLGLDRSALVDQGRDTTLLPWRGDLIMNTLAIVLRREGIEVSPYRVALECPGISAGELLAVLTRLAAAVPPDPIALARAVVVKERDKYDQYLGESLLTEAFAARNLDVPATWEALREIVGVRREA